MSVGVLGRMLQLITEPGVKPSPDALRPPSTRRAPGATSTQVAAVTWQIALLPPLDVLMKASPFKSTVPPAADSTSTQSRLSSLPDGLVCTSVITSSPAAGQRGTRATPP